MEHPGTALPSLVGQSLPDKETGGLGEDLRRGLGGHNCCALRLGAKILSVCSPLLQFVLLFCSRITKNDLRGWLLILGKKQGWGPVC